MKYIVYLVLCMNTLFAAGTLENCTAYYSQGVKAYEEEKFPQAIQFFESCASEGVESWVVYYNLGNAWYRNGSLGSAVLNYEKALLLNPGETDVMANLEFVRAQIKDKQEQDPSASILDSWYRFMTLNTTYLLVFALLFLVSVSISILVLVKGPIRFAVYPVIIGAVFVLLLLTVSITFKLYQLNSVSHGVLLAESATVLSGPGAKFETLFEIHEGTKFEIIENNGEWLSINLGNGKMGYIPSKSTGIIH